MLIPQFSIRWLLGLTTVCAVIFSVVAIALQGSRWAAGVSIGVGALVVAMLVYGALFTLVWMFAEFTSWRAGRLTKSRAEQAVDAQIVEPSAEEQSLSNGGPTA